MANERRKAIKLLNDAGYFLKDGGSGHDKYYNESLRKTITLKRHKVDKDVIRYINNEIKHNAGK